MDISRSAAFGANIACFARLDYAFIGLPCGLDGSFVGSISLEAFSNFGLACKGTSISLRMIR